MRPPRSHLARFETEAMRSDGTPFPAEVSLTRIDVTDRERARMAITERSARLQVVFELCPAGSVVFDGDSKLVYCNPAFLAMTGWRADPDIVGLGVQEFEARMLAQCEVDPAQRPQPLPEVPAPGADQAPETMLLARPGRREPARQAHSPHDGHVETILLFRDVTRETEFDRMKSESRTTAAHELRTPLFSVFGFTELLPYRRIPEERQRDMLVTIHRQNAAQGHNKDHSVRESPVGSESPPVNRQPALPPP